MKDYLSFEQAVERLRFFLKSDGLPDVIVWVHPNSVVLVRDIFFISSAPSDGAWEWARSQYQLGCDRGIGVELGALCQIKGAVCCFVYLPQDEDEAVRHLMPDGLKLIHPVPVPDAQVV